MIDKTRAVRSGEELDTNKLAVFLSEQTAQFSGVLGNDLRVEQFPGGHSNLTYLLKVEGRGEYVLRRPPFGNQVKSAHDMGREVRVLTKLAPVYSPIPHIVAYCDNESVLGAPFYVMERISGVILRKKLPDGIAIDESLAQRLSTSLIDHLAELHSVDYVAAGLGDFGKPVGYVDRQVRGWAERYAKAQTDDVPDVLTIAEWLKSMLSTLQSTAVSVLHNDWKYDNLIFDSSEFGNPPHNQIANPKIIGVLDWEMATIGDPLMDLGTALSYWIEPNDDDLLKSFAFGPTALPGSLSRKELAARYAEKTKSDISNILFYYCFALFKTAVVAQQIYTRYKKGLTHDERFASMIIGVQTLSRIAVHATKTGQI